MLRWLPPGPGREAHCKVANAAAVAAVTDAGYLPVDPESVPQFLLRTQQWDRFAERDPTGKQLYAFCGQPLSRDPEQEAKQMARILLNLAADVDAAAALHHAGRRALHDVGPGAVRDLLHRRATSGHAAAARIVDAEDERRFQQAADAGDAAAMYTLELFLSERGEPNEAEQWYRRAVDAGNHAALNNMGPLLEQRLAAPVPRTRTRRTGKT